MASTMLRRTRFGLLALMSAVLMATAILVPAAASGGTSAIQGQVLGTMDPLGSATVTVFDAATGAKVASVVTDGDGYYRIDGLPATAVKVRATKAGWITSWANGRQTKATADVFQLSPGRTLSQSWDPMVLYLDLLRPGVLSGDVLAINDDPAAAFDDPLPGVLVTAYDAATGGKVRSTRTDTAGSWRITNLRGGDYKVRAAKAGWLNGWADGGTSKATADVISLCWTCTQQVPTLVLYAPATIQGQVLGWMDPLGDAKVSVFDAVTGTKLRTSYADSSGSYRITNLRPGRITVRGSKVGWNPSWANGRPSKATADSFVLWAGRTLSQSWDPMVLYLDLTPRQSVG